MRIGSIGAVAVASLAGAVVGVAPMAAAKPAPEAAKSLCSMTYLTPDNPEVNGSSEVKVDRNSNGSLELTLITDANSKGGYDQSFTATWANIDTGRSGSGDAKTWVAGHRTLLSIPEVWTEPGRIAFVFGTSNQTGQSVTSGQCMAEYAA
ncbi:hypothetical protein ACFWPX_26320 [Nocardia sp. NPDC058518]|uniref:hypothetical protein n=1 Tax=Nocardia sp. NPDC058518 TaxID=3346534 RepID=UPI003665B526